MYTEQMIGNYKTEIKSQELNQLLSSNSELYARPQNLKLIRVDFPIYIHHNFLPCYRVCRNGVRTFSTSLLGESSMLLTSALPVVLP